MEVYHVYLSRNRILLQWVADEGVESSPYT